MTTIFTAPATTTIAGPTTAGRAPSATVATRRRRARAAAVAGAVALALVGLAAGPGHGVAAAMTSASTTASPAPSPCTAAAIGADTAMTLLPDVVCAAGFAMALPAAVGAATPATGDTATGDTATTVSFTTTSVAPAPYSGPCERVDSCGYARFFHVTTSGWVDDGEYTRECAEDIEITFISPGAASTFAPVCDAAGWPTPETVQRGSRGTAVMYVQIALVAIGERLAVSGTFDIGTHQAVQRFQRDRGLEPNGIVGPETHVALGTGADPSPTPPATTTTATATTGPPASTTTTTTTVAVAPGPAPPCTAAAITADTTITLAGEPGCAAGWAVIVPAGCGGSGADGEILECESFDVFHVTDEGWVYDGQAYSGCAWALAEATGMSEYTAASFSFACDVAPVARTNIEPGSTGAPVTRVQIALVALGYPVAVDGTFGPRTEAAVHHFQGRNGLAADGIAGPSTQEALGI